MVEAQIGDHISPEVAETNGVGGATHRMDPEEVAAASSKQCLGWEPERGKTFYGREGHLPSHLAKPPGQGGVQRGGGWGPRGWGILGPMLRLREAHGPQKLRQFGGGGRGPTGPTEISRNWRGTTNPMEGGGLGGGRWSRLRCNRFPSSADGHYTHTQMAPLLPSLSCPLA